MTYPAKRLWSRVSFGQMTFRQLDFGLNSLFGQMKYLAKHVPLRSLLVNAILVTFFSFVSPLLLTRDIILFNFILKVSLNWYLWVTVFDQIDVANRRGTNPIKGSNRMINVLFKSFFSAQNSDFLQSEWSQHSEQNL